MKDRQLVFLSKQVTLLIMTEIILVFATVNSELANVPTANRWTIISPLNQDNDHLLKGRRQAVFFTHDNNEGLKKNCDSISHNDSSLLSLLTGISSFLKRNTFFTELYLLLANVKDSNIMMIMPKLRGGSSDGAVVSTTASVSTRATNLSSSFVKTSSTTKAENNYNSTQTRKTTISSNTTENAGTGEIRNNLLPSSLNLTIHEDVLTRQECRTIIALARRLIRPSTVGRPARIVPALRLSESCKLPRLPIPALWSVEYKLAKAADVPIEYGEDLQVGRYGVGHYYGLHCDERPGGRPNGGGRLATALAYLNTLDDDDSNVMGGETLFSGCALTFSPGEVDFLQGGTKRVTELQRYMSSTTTDNDRSSSVRVPPREGRVITFRNLVRVSGTSGDCGKNKEYQFISESTHGACPVLKKPNSFGGKKGWNEKWVVQQWFGLSTDINLPRHPNLIAHIGLGVAGAYQCCSPMADLASSTGLPLATTGTAKMQIASFLLPNIGATRIRSGGIEAKGQPLLQTTPTTNNEGEAVVGAMWVCVNNDDSTSTTKENRHRLFRVGPHALWRNIHDGSLSWSIITNDNDTITTSTNHRLKKGQWYHVALTTRKAYKKKNNDNTFIITAQLSISIPGQEPQPPYDMEITSLKKKPIWISGISIGSESGSIDMTVTDFYALHGVDMTTTNKGAGGHSLAYAVSYYDPGT